MEKYEKKAEYLCESCKYFWIQQCRPLNCPKCKHEYVTWVNHPLIKGNKND